MLAPYANVGAFMKEWRSRAPPTHHGFGNRSSPSPTATTTDWLAYATSLVPYDSPTSNPSAELTASLSEEGHEFNKHMIIVGVTVGIPLLLGLGTSIWYFVRAIKARRALKAAAAREITVEHVDESHSPPDSTYGSLSASSSPPASSSPNAPVQQPETQVRRANSPGAIDGPTSTPSSPPPSGTVVENWVESVILPRQPGGILAVRSPPTNMR
ncbi:hypothetical protein KCU93_g2569, partial [Aureobasidium melanogenum]